MNVEELVRLYEKGVLDFSGVTLRGANLNGVNLSGTDLSGADLSGAYLRYARLSDANLSDANLSDANLSGANFNGANLNGANLDGADLSGADLSGASLWDAKGNGFEIINGPINMFYSITMTKHAIQIGCKNYSYEEWLNFIDEDIKDMDYDALGFWNDYRDAVLGLWVGNFGGDQ